MGTSSAMSTSNQYIKYKITVKQNSQNIASNYSSVTVTVNFYRTNTGYTSYGTGTVYCKINGTTYTASVSPSQKITNSGINLFSKTLNIYHNNDGTKTLTCSAWISHDVVTSSEQSYSQTLTTIPRTSNITLSASSVTMGNSITIYTNRASNSFTHKLYYEIGSSGWVYIGGSITTSTSWTVPLNFANSTPNSTNLTVKLWLETYNGSTYIGNSSKTFTAQVPSSVVPTVNSVTLTEAVSGLAAQFGGFVKGKSKIKGTISASGSYSSTIKSYSSKINGATYTASSFTTGYLTGNGSCVTTVKDSRGRATSKTVNYTCFAYSNPSIQTFTVTRCNSDGTLNDEGACCKCTIQATVSPVNNKNTKDFTLLYKKLTDTEYQSTIVSNENYTLDTTYILEDIDTESEYELILQVSDYFMTTKKSQNLSTAYTLVDYNASGKGIAFGKVSTDNVMDINMDIYTNDLIRMGYGTNAEKNIRFQNLAEAQKKTYDTDGIYPHSCKMYGGNSESPIGIGWWDSQNEYRILSFNDHAQRLIYGTKGLYAPQTGGIYFSDYGNIETQAVQTSGYWAVRNNSKNYFRVNWSDGTLAGLNGTIYVCNNLFYNASGTQSTVTLSDSSANYTYLEILYKNNDNYYGSVRVMFPNGKKTVLTSNTASSSQTYFKNTTVTISGTSITFGTGTEVYGTTNSTNNRMYIFSVNGYK